MKKSFNKRAFISIMLLFSGLILPFSGIMNHALQLEPMSVERHLWMSVHNMSAALFTLFALLHVIMNRRALLNGLKSLKRISMSREAALALTVMILVVGLFSSHAFHVH